PYRGVRLAQRPNTEMCEKNITKSPATQKEASSHSGIFVTVNTALTVPPGFETLVGPLILRRTHSHTPLNGFVHGCGRGSRNVAVEIVTGLQETLLNALSIRQTFGKRKDRPRAGFA